MWVQDFAGPAGLPADPEVWTHEVGGGGWGDRQRQVYTADVSNAAEGGAPNASPIPSLPPPVG